jgi:hypothetical protein
MEKITLFGDSAYVYAFSPEGIRKDIGRVVLAHLIDPKF